MSRNLVTGKKPVFRKRLLVLLKTVLTSLAKTTKDVKKSGEGRQKDRRKMPFGVFCSAKDGKKSDKPVKDKKSQMKHSSDITTLKFEHFAVAGA